MPAHISSRALNSVAYAYAWVLGLWLLALIGAASSGTAQTPICSHAADTSQVLLYSPFSNGGRSEMEMLGRAKVSIAVSKYSFNDRELVEELGQLARTGVRVRVYRDSAQYD